ncbi:MAG: fimbrial biogenesis outer membrane usher protein [Ramlibacter sp.]|nr:fimbrial biogenesis outer membrane usher protein [Ramlibacter sp.]
MTSWGQPRPDTLATSAPLERIVPLEAIVNGQKTGTWAFVERLNALYAQRDAFEEWRVQARAEPIIVRGTPYYPLSAIPGFSVKVNYANQSVEINFSPDAFMATKLTTELADRPPISPVLPSVFANYELNYNRSQVRRGTLSQDLGALVELGASTPWGVLTSSHVGRNLSHVGTAESGWTRLETTFTHHRPLANETVRVGDAATRAGLWGRTVYFGGVQYSTDYSLTPGFLTQPLPVVRGVSTTPSTVELYVNDVLRQVSQVPAGPFAIDNTSALTGNGEARLVVRDVLGREVVITQPFFSTAQLLAPGLADWSFEAGRLRKDLGLASNVYGETFGVGTWRRGITERLTIELRAEKSQSLRATGVGAIAALPGDVLGRVAIATSHEDHADDGYQWLAGLERQWMRSSLSVQAQGATHGFRTLGMTDTLLPIRSQLAANFTYGMDDYGSIAANVASIRRFDGPRLTTVSLNYAYRFGPAKVNSISVALSHAFGAGQAGGSSLGVTLQLPLENNRQFTATTQSRGGTTDAYATVSQAEGLNSGWGWRALGGRVSNETHAEGGLYYTGEHGRVYSDLSASPSQTSWRAGVLGGLVFAGGYGFATRRLDQSFALVEVRDNEGIGVGIGTNMVTHTDSRGIALLPNLSAWQLNQVRLNPTDLPISTEVVSIEELVVPSWRSGVKAAFPVRMGRAALVRVVLDDGEPAPPGAVVRIEGDKEEFIVARRGEAFVTGLQPSSLAFLSWQEQKCALELILPAAAKDEVLRLGPVACHGVKR